MYPSSSYKGTFAKTNDDQALIDYDRDTPGPRTMAEIGDSFLRDLVQKLKGPPLVILSGPYFEFYRDGVMVYDVSVSNALDALGLLCHLSEKSWFTPQHSVMFTQLAKNKFQSELR